MKTLNFPVKFLAYAVYQAIRHPLTPIAYYICECGCRFTASNPVCPRCGDKVKE